MKYRTFPKLPDLKLSQFGMGIMRMPIIEVDGVKKIERKQSAKMIDAALDGGVNYFDTAYNYHDGDSEQFVGEYLVPKIKQYNLHIATKLPQWLVKEEGDYDKFLNGQLEKLGLNQIEFYLVHSFGDASWKKHKELGIIEFLKRAVSDGRIKYPCFSYHGSVETLKEIIDAYDGWIFAQIMLNYIDENWQAGVKGMKYASSKDVGIIIMEPLKGGMLVNQLPQQTVDFFKNKNISPVSSAMNWCYNFKEPKVVLSGVSTLEQTLGQIEIAKYAEVGKLTDAERQAIKFSKANFDLVPCSGCEYCMPCPAGVDIPSMIQLYNSYFVFGKKEIKAQYAYYLKEGIDAGNCTECGACESICPQSIDIIEKIKKVHEAMKD